MAEAQSEGQTLERVKTDSTTSNDSILARLGRCFIIAKNVILSVIGTISLVAIIYIVYKDITEPKITISPIVVPKEFNDAGRTPSAVASHLQNSLKSIVDHAQETLLNSPTLSEKIVTEKDLPDISLTANGVSLETVLSTLRSYVFGDKHWYISGDIQNDKQEITIHIVLKHDDNLYYLIDHFNSPDGLDDTARQDICISIDANQSVHNFSLLFTK